MTTYAATLGDVLQWSEEYDGPPFHALLSDAPYHLTTITRRFGKADAAPAQFGSDGAFQRALTPLCALDSSIGSTVARIAQGDEVAQVVRFAVAVKAEQAERLDVMNFITRTVAVLAGVVVTLQRLAPLRLPVRPPLLASFTADVLRVIQAVAVGISAGARAVLTTALALRKPAKVDAKRLSAVEARQVTSRSTLGARFNRSILALTGAMFTAAVLEA